MKEQAGRVKLPRFAEFARLASPLARFGKVDRTATNQKVGSSNPPGRTTYLSRIKHFQPFPKQLRFRFSVHSVQQRVFETKARSTSPLFPHPFSATPRHAGLYLK